MSPEGFEKLPKWPESGTVPDAGEIVHYKEFEGVTGREARWIVLEVLEGNNIKIAKTSGATEVRTIIVPVAEILKFHQEVPDQRPDSLTRAANEIKALREKILKKFSGDDSSKKP